MAVMEYGELTSQTKALLVMYAGTALSWSSAAWTWIGENESQLTVGLAALGTYITYRAARSKKNKGT